MAFIEERVDTVESDIAEINGRLGRIEDNQTLHGEVLARHTEQLAAIRATLEDLRSGLNVLLGEVDAQKAWREEFSSKVARLIAKSEDVDA
ncbi:hypothetical protein AB0M95_10000 [Sphaerisporangium sp. NPDC051017]|uniref:hypothetical protein n=1 Tax=Sphaerisporangium sp. NPDC051017 TaxID=3154636 RepID=UPI0034178137